MCVQCSHASVGLAHARPNYELLVFVPTCYLNSGLNTGIIRDFQCISGRCGSV